MSKFNIGDRVKVIDKDGWKISDIVTILDIFEDRCKVASEHGVNYIIMESNLEAIQN